MKAAVFHSKENIRLEDIPRPKIGPGELLVRTVGVGLCGSDIDKILCEAVAPGTILGHEVVGVVAEVGKGVHDFQGGERVTLAHHVSCQACHYCDRGSDSKCALFRATHLDPGGFAEYTRVPPPNVRLATFPIPENLTFEQAVFMEPLACCVRAIERSRVRPGDTVLLVGMGSIGLLFVQLVKLQQAKVLASDLFSDRLELAQAYGAAVSINASKDPLKDIVMAVTDGRGVDMVLASVASQPVLDQALSVVRDGGLLHFFAAKRGGLAVTLDLNELYEREVALLTTYSSSPRALREAFRLIAAGEVRTEELISHRVPLANLLQGVQMMATHEALKVYIEV